MVIIQMPGDRDNAPLIKDNIIMIPMEMIVQHTMMIHDYLCLIVNHYR